MVSFGQVELESISGWQNASTTVPKSAWKSLVEKLDRWFGVLPTCSFIWNVSLSLWSFIYVPTSELGSESKCKLCFGRLEELALNISVSFTLGAGSFFSDCGTLVIAYFFGGKGGGGLWLTSFGIWQPSDLQVDWIICSLDREFSEQHCSILVCCWMRGEVSGFTPTGLMCEDHSEDDETTSLLFILFPGAELSSWKSKPVLSEFSVLSHSENLHSLGVSSFCSPDWWICSLAALSLSICGPDEGNNFPFVSRICDLQQRNKDKAKRQNWRKNKHLSCSLTSQYIPDVIFIT